MSDAQKLSCYISGLKPSIALGVKLFNPKDMVDATRFAKIQELSLGVVIKDQAIQSGTRIPKGVPMIWEDPITL